MPKLKIFFFLVLSMIFADLFSQEIIIEKDLKESPYAKKENGPNLKHFRHLYLDLEFFTGTEQTGTRINYGSSYVTGAGFRYKLKLTELYSIGYDLGYSRFNYNIRQENSKFFPNNIIHDKEKIVLHNLNLEFYNRINLKKRGNQIGTYIDIGIYGAWVVGGRNITIDAIDNSVYHSEKQRSIYRNLSYLNNFYAGLRARFGINRYSLVAGWRLTPLLDDTEYSSSASLSTLSAGLQIGLF